MSRYGKLYACNLKRIMKETHTTQEELAIETFLTQSTISRYVNGEIAPPVDIAKLIARLLDHSLDDFFKE